MKSNEKKTKATLLPPVTRRKFLSLLGAAGAAIGIGPKIPAAAAAAPAAATVGVAEAAATAAATVGVAEAAATGALLRHASLVWKGVEWMGSSAVVPQGTPHSELELEVLLSPGDADFLLQPRARITVEWLKQQPRSPQIDDLVEMIDKDAVFEVTEVLVTASAAGMTVATIKAVEVFE